MIGPFYMKDVPLRGNETGQPPHPAKMVLSELVNDYLDDFPDPKEKHMIQTYIPMLADGWMGSEMVFPAHSIAYKEGQGGFFKIARLTVNVDVPQQRMSVMFWAVKTQFKLADR